MIDRVIKKWRGFLLRIYYRRLINNIERFNELLYMIGYNRSRRRTYWREIIKHSGAGILNEYDKYTGG